MTVGELKKYLDKVTDDFEINFVCDVTVEFEELDDDKIFVLSVKDYENCTTEIINEVIE